MDDPIQHIHKCQFDVPILAEGTPSARIQDILFLKGVNALLRYYPQGMNDPWDVKYDTENNINQKIFAKALFDEHCNKGQQDRQNDEQHTTFFLLRFLLRHVLPS